MANRVSLLMFFYLFGMRNAIKRKQGDSTMKKEINGITSDNKQTKMGNKIRNLYGIDFRITHL